MHTPSELLIDPSTRSRRKSLTVSIAVLLIVLTVGVVWRIDSRSLAGKDLRGVDFTGADLSGRNLAKSDLEGAMMAGANLAGSNLSGAQLPRASLDGADLSGANLAGANLAGARLTKADLTGANLSGAVLDGANLFQANLANANLTAASLDGGYFEKADFTSASLAGSILTRKTVIRDSKGLTDAALAEALGISETAVPRALIEKKLRIDFELRLKDGLSAACVGVAIEGTHSYPGGTDYHPLATFTLNSPLTTYEIDGMTSNLGWEPMVRRHTQLVACVDKGWKVVQRCPGEWFRDSDNRRVDLRRVRAWAHVRLIAASNAAVVADFNLDGPSPPACPYRRYTEADETGAMYGDAIPFDQFRELLEPFVAPS